MEVRIQSVVVEFILNHVDVLFSGKISAVMQEGAGMAQIAFPYYEEQVSKGMERTLQLSFHLILCDSDRQQLI